MLHYAITIIIITLFITEFTDKQDQQHLRHDDKTIKLKLKHKVRLKTINETKATTKCRMLKIHRTHFNKRIT